jgi:hypothetical protein
MIFYFVRILGIYGIYYCNVCLRMNTSILLFFVRRNRRFLGFVDDGGFVLVRLSTKGGSFRINYI